MKTLLLLLFAGLISWGCSAFYGESTAPTLKDVQGSYTLVTYDGKPLPYRIDSTLTVLSDTLVLDAGGEYDELIAYQKANGSVAVVRYNGRYSFGGDYILVQFDSGGGFILEIPQRGILTENDGNGIIVYQKPE